MEEIDAGHLYQLLTLDGELRQNLQFVKRCGEKFPGNKNEYPGTILQSVLRACYARIMYLQGQKWCLENLFLSWFIVWGIWLLEFRAGRRRGKMYWHLPAFALKTSMCVKCGHTECEH